MNKQRIKAVPAKEWRVGDKLISFASMQEYEITKIVRSGKHHLLVEREGKGWERYALSQRIYLERQRIRPPTIREVLRAAVRFQRVTCKLGDEAATVSELRQEICGWRKKGRTTTVEMPPCNYQCHRDKKGYLHFREVYT